MAAGERSSTGPKPRAAVARTDRPARDTTDVVLRVATCAIVIALGVAGLVLADRIVSGGLAWLGFLLAVLAGWGSVVQRLAGARDVDLGLRLVWGAVGYLAVAGLMLGLGVCSRPMVLALVGFGAIAFVWHELTAEVPAWRRVVEVAQAARREPAVTILVAVIATAVALRVIAAAVRLDTNPYDDDVAYTPLLRRLLDLGDLDEAFGFRRLSAYGGQTVLHALVGARGNLTNLHLIDAGLFQLISLFLVVGHARSLRTVPAFWTGLVVLMLLLLPAISLNTACYWTGIALFLGLYRTLARDDAARRSWILVGVIAAMAATLRQNHLPVAVVAVGCALLFRLHAARLSGRTTWRKAWHSERRLWAAAAFGGVVALAPYAVAALRSNDTFLYPLVGGTWNHRLVLAPAVYSLTQELELFIRVFVEPDPIRVLPILVPLFLVTRDARRARPLTAFVVAAAVGVVMLVHGFALSDPINLWRYATPFVTPLCLAFLIEAGALGLDPAASGHLRLPVVGRLVAVMAVLVQIAFVRANVPRQYREIATDIQVARAMDRARSAPRVAADAAYARLQAALPAGARVAVLLDEPFRLDYARNDIVTLDTPGFASEPPGMPAFRGPEALRTYFLARGIRHVAFVRGDRARYAYRRDYWVRRMFADVELFQITGAYTVDCLDNLAALAATSRVLHEEDGMVVVDLGAPP